MLANTLNTNEVKDRAGVEVEFSRISTGEGRKTVFSKIGESPYTPYRMTVSHSEAGSGIDLVRRSVLRFDKTVVSSVDSSKLVVPAAYTVISYPVGALTAATEMENVLANLMSILATTGAGTTVLLDCTGTGASALISGQI